MKSSYRILKGSFQKLDTASVSFFQKTHNMCVKILLLSFMLSFSFLSAYEEDRGLLLEETRLEVGFVTGHFIGLREDYLELGAFVPILYCDDFFSFIDVKGYRFDNSKWGSSVGLGLRTTCNEVTYGSNIYYDFLQGRFRNFNRLGVGLEYLGPRFDLRLNGYLPILNDERHSRNVVFDDFEGDFCATCKRRQFSPRGAFDLEVGFPIGCWNDFSSYFAIGPYYYNWRIQKSYWGGQARLELYWRTFFSIQVETSYDRVNHSQTAGKFLAFIPFDFFNGGDSYCNPCKSLLYQPVVRNGTIFTDTCCDFRWNWD